MESRRDSAIVILRLGGRWPDHRDHRLVYFPDSLDDAGMLMMWDADEDTYTAVPRLTLRTPWTKRMTGLGRGEVLERCRMEFGRVEERVNLQR